MNPIKQKAPGGNPEPSKTRVTASAVPRSNEQINSGTAPASEQVNRPQAHYLASLAYGEVVEATVSRAQTKPEAAFELIDHYTFDLMLKAGLAEQVSLYLLLSEYSSYEEKYGSIRYYSAPRAELAKRLGKTQSTVSRWLSKLEAAGFISTYYQRQTESPGVSRVAGNAYVLEHRQLRGKLAGAAIYQEPVVDTANSEPMTQSTEAEITLEVGKPVKVGKPGITPTMALGLQVLSTPNRPTSSSTATATSTTSYSNMTTPLVKNGELVISLRDLDRDLFKPGGKKSSNHSKLKGKRASDSQLELVRQRLSTDRQRAALIHYELEELSQLTGSMANELIMASNKLKPELLNLLDLTLSERKEKAQNEVRAREAATQSQRDYEAAQSVSAEQVSLYGRELSEAEMTGRITLIRAALRNKSEPALRARGTKLKEVEALFVITPTARLAHLLELITAA
jgi:DNA-binding transcriptional ArsR family regulator